MLSLSISPPTKHQIFFTKLRKYSPNFVQTRLFKKLLFPLDYKRVEIIQPKPSKVYYCHNPKGITLLTRLRLGLSHLGEHKFKHSFQDCLNPLCFCGNEIETSTHYDLLHCPTYTNERMTLLNKTKSINCSILEFSDAVVKKILLFGDNTLSDSCNTLILNSTIDYIISTKRFDDSILTPG